MKRFILALFLCAALFGAEVTVKDVSVSLRLPYGSGCASSNFTSISASNSSQKRARDVKLMFYGSDGLIEVDLGIIDAGQSLSKTVYLDMDSIYNAYVVVDGSSKDIRFSNYHYRYSESNNILLSKGVGTAQVTSLLQDMSSYSKLEPAFMENEPMLTDIRVLNYYCGIMTTLSEWEALEKDKKDAIIAYVRLGGNMAIWGSSITTDQRIGLPRNCGFGRVDYITSNITGVNDAYIKRVVKSLQKTVWDNGYDAEKLDSFFVLGTDSRGQSVSTKVSPALMAKAFMVVSIFFILAVTICLICKVRTKVFIILPVTSLVASALIIAAANGYLGRDKYMRIDELTVLDGRAGKATSASVFGFYSSVETSGVMRLPAKDLFNRLSPEYDDRVMQVDETVTTIKSLSLPGAPLVYRLRRDGDLPQNSLLVFTGGEQGVQVSNPTDKTYSALTFMDYNDKLWQLDAPLAPGETAAMTPSEMAYSPEPDVLNRFITGNWCVRMVVLYKNLNPGCYTALADSPSVVLDLDAEFDHETTNCHVYGITQEAEK